MAILINAHELAEITKLVVSTESSAGRFQCIKRVRELTGLGLREAIGLVEAALPGEDAVVRIARAICGQGYPHSKWD